MEQYISKSALVAEIERRKHKFLDNIIFERDKEWVVRTAHQLNRIKDFIDTLEVKEVDINKEISKDRYEQLLQYEQERKQRQSMINSFMQNK
jgi:late competence protein required for DNA uptake (superfamily II DNA/RNA helicase)